MPMIELILVLAITALMAVWSSTRLIQEADDINAVATGVYVDTVAAGAQRYMLNEFLRLSAGTDVAGIATDLQPTLAELRALGRLPSAFPLTAPNNQSISVFLTRTNCPGSNCQLTAMACLTQPFQSRGRFREDLATVAMMAMSGRGGRSHDSAPSQIRGASILQPNPLGSVSGILCGQSNVDAGVFEAFARVRDTRDLDLRGGLTITGVTPTGETLRVNGDLMTADPSTGTACIKLLRNGQIDIQCDGRLNARTGIFSSAAGTVQLGNTGTGFQVDTNGRVRGEQGFWSALGTLYGDNSLGVRAAGTVFTIQTSSAIDALAIHDDGRTGARKSVATPALGLTSPVSAGDTCGTPSTQVGATQVTNAATTVLRALIGGGLAICDPSTGVWSPVNRVAAEGTPCSPNGITAITAAGVMLICTNAAFVRLDDRMGYLVEMASWRVGDGGLVPKPDCPVGSRGARLYLGAGNELQQIQRLNRYSVDNGPNWTVNLKDGLGRTIQGDLLITTYCQY